MVKAESNQQAVARGQSGDPVQVEWTASGMAKVTKYLQRELQVENPGVFQNGDTSDI